MRSLSAYALRNNHKKMKRFSNYYAQILQRLRQIHRRVLTQAPYCKQREIAMRIKMLIDYITQQYKEFTKPEFKAGLKRRNSQQYLGLQESEAENVRMHTQKSVFWEERKYDRSVRQINQLLVELQGQLKKDKQRIRLCIRVHGMLSILNANIDTVQIFVKRSKDWYKAETHQVLGCYKMEIKAVICKNKSSVKQ